MTAQRLVWKSSDGIVFYPCKFEDLQKGDHFKIQDDLKDGKRIEDGDHMYTALEDPTPCEPEGNYQIQIAVTSLRTGLVTKQ